MKVLVFGATGMVGQRMLRECPPDPDVEQVQTVGRTSTGIHHPKLRKVLHRDLSHYAGIESELSGFDACFFSLGVSSAGMKAEDDERVTYGITMAAAETLCRLNPQMKFFYISGAGTESSEQGRTMWARVKGRTENALLRLPFAAAYMFRPGLIVPVHGEKPKAAIYHSFYSIAKPLLFLLRRIFPKHVLTTEEIGQAMLVVARRGYPKPILEITEIRAIAHCLSDPEDLAHYS